MTKLTYEDIQLMTGLIREVIAMDGGLPRNAHKLRPEHLIEVCGKAETAASLEALRSWVGHYLEMPNDDLRFNNLRAAYGAAYE